MAYTHSITINGATVTCRLMDEKDGVISHCTMHVEEGTWKIALWHTVSTRQNTGVDKECMKRLMQHVIDTTGAPKRVEYTWNGQNQYVHDWMVKHFNAKCDCPIAVLKNQAGNDWPEAHIYVLDPNLLMLYMGLRMPSKGGKQQWVRQ